MAQYCRYCSSMVCGDVNYCAEKRLCMSDKQIKAPNHCKQFDFNSIDALGENERGYRPRENKQKEHIKGQLSFTDIGE